MRQTFNDGRFAHTRFADQDRIILGLPAQNPDDPADFRIPPDHRVQLVLLRFLDEVSSVLFERFIGRLR